jgi:DNA polymerase III epsilon subunit-like protein
METQEIVPEHSFFIGDTETTGLKNKRACEVALVQIDPVDLSVIRTFSSLIDPQQPIEDGAAAIHGITNEMVKAEPTMDEFVAHPAYLNGGILGEITLICHNVTFDLPLLESIGCITRTVCTLEESRAIRHLLPGLENCKLQTLREYFGIERNNAHRALDDCMVTLAVLKEILRITGRTLDALADVKERVIHRMPWGIHVGKPLHEVPVPYLQWMLTRDINKNLRTSVEKSLAMR